MKILLAGGAGYIGTLLAIKLKELGYDVDIIDLLWFGNNLPDDINVEQKDLFECSAKDLEQYDQVVFLAGLSNDPMAEFSPAMNFVHNGALPLYLAYEAKKAGVKRYVYASSCSVYGYTVNELYDEESPVNCGYPYGIAKLQGENGVFQMAEDDFSMISLRQGTVCGYSPRMRFDLIVNTMFKFAMTEGKITVNNPAIWRPIFDIRDTVSAFIRAIQADYSITGVFNVASGNYTVGHVGDMVKSEVEKLTGRNIALEIKNIQDFRNYKVSIKKAETILGFIPQYDIKDIIRSIYDHMDSYGDYSRKEYYNIVTFKEVDALNSRE